MLSFKQTFKKGGVGIFFSRVDEQTYVYRNAPNGNSIMKNDDDFLCFGEDPRIVRWNDKVFVHDNTLNKSRLINLYDTSESYTIPLKGKNFIFLSTATELFVVEWLVPLRVYRVEDFASTDTKSDTKCTQIDLRLIFQGTEKKNQEFRGGTNTIYDSTKGVWRGLGHRTYTSPKLTHDPFYFEIEKKDDTFSIEIKPINVEHRRNAIVDPTCVYMDDGTVHVMTAESSRPWYIKNQNFESNVYVLKSF